MAQKAQKTQPEQVIENAKAEAAATEAEALANRSSENLFALAKTPSGRDVFPNKAQFMSDIRQKLAQVADEAEENGEQAAETERLADMSATRLYQARISGMITSEEMSALLVDIFGAVPKQDGTPGKTPAGAGGTIRKRIVRAVQGYDFVNGGDGGRFFETMEKEQVAPVVLSIGRTKTLEHTDPETGQVTKETVPDGPSIWHAYKLLGDIKSQNTVRLPFAFDAKKIIGLTDSLSEAGARDKLLNNPALLRAYAGLFDQLQVIAQVDKSEVDAVKAALGVVEPEGDENETEEEGGEQVAA